MSVTSFRLYSYAPRKKGKKPIKKILLSLIILIVLIEICLYGFVVYQGKQFQPQKSDVLIVLGCTIHKDQPSLLLQNRLDTAIDLFNQGYANQIIVSGGQGKDEELSEAEAMKTYLVNHGIPEDVIMIEDKSTSTYENLKFSKQIMDKAGYNTALLVTNDFHIYRSVHIASKIGVQATGATAPSNTLLIHYYRIRETLAILYYWLMI